MILTDFPNVRASALCPLCGGGKDAGLLVCWSCYRENDLRYGNHEAEKNIEAAEKELSKKPR